MTIAIRPSWRARNGRGCRADLGRARRSIFLRRGLDGANQVDCVGEICAIAHYRTRSPPIVVHRKYGFRSARLHFPTRWTVLACSNSACLRGPRREPVFLFASARGGFDAHGMLRSSSLAHLRWWRGGHWKRFASICPLALTSIPSGTPVCLRTCSPPLVALGCGTGGTSKNAKFGNRGARRRAGGLRFFRCGYRTCVCLAGCVPIIHMPAACPRGSSHLDEGGYFVGRPGQPAHKRRRRYRGRDLLASSFLRRRR